MIERLLQTHNIPYVGAEHHHGKVGWLNIDCPYCGFRSGKFHLGININGKYVNCWKCGKHRFIDALIESGIPQKEAWDVYKHDTPVDIPQPKETGVLKMPYHTKMGKQHRRYLRRRGFDPDEIERLWDVRGIRLTVGYEWRLLIPVYLGNEIVSWTTRSIRDTEKVRYKSARPEFEKIPHKQLLYGEEYCRHAVIVHEGPLDVWATGPGSVSMFGLNWSQAQIYRLSQYAHRIVCLDATTDAQSRANALCDLLDVFPGTTVNVRLESGKDTAEADPEEVAELRALLEQ